MFKAEKCAELIAPEVPEDDWSGLMEIARAEGPLLDFRPEDAGRAAGGRPMVRFAGVWWDSAAVAYLAPRRVRLAKSDGSMLVVLADDGEPRALLMATSWTDEDIKRFAAEAEEGEPW